MSLRPTHIALDKNGSMFVVIDDYPETSEALLVPCSFAHRRVASRAEYQAMELHPSRDSSRIPVEEAE